MKWAQLCSSLNILWHCPSLILDWKLTSSSPVAIAEFSKFACKCIALFLHIVPHIQYFNFNSPHPHPVQYFLEILACWVTYWLGQKVCLGFPVNSYGENPNKFFCQPSIILLHFTHTCIVFCIVKLLWFLSYFSMGNHLGYFELFTITNSSVMNTFVQYFLGTLGCYLSLFRLL